MNKKLCAFLMAMIVMVTLINAVISNRIVAAQSNPPQPTEPAPALPTQKWEYRIVDGDSISVQYAANQLSEQGFEIFDFKVTDNGFTAYHMVFKRPKP